MEQFFYPADPGKAPVHDLTTQGPGFHGFDEILYQVSPRLRGKDGKFGDSVEIDVDKSGAASKKGIHELQAIIIRL